MGRSGVVRSASNRAATRRARHRSGVVVVALLILTGCSTTSGGPAGGSSAHSGGASSPAASGGIPSGWVEENVSFTAGGVTVYGTYRHATASTRGPAALLIAGSGPADRNGDEPGFPEASLRLLADQLAADGIATLRYDKLYSGRTGAGEPRVDPTTARVATFTGEAAAAAHFLAAQPRTDPQALSVYGHSEGGLYALLLATASGGDVPHIATVGLIEPQSRRFFDILADQLHAQIATATSQGKITASAAAVDSEQIDQAISAVRAGQAPGPLPQFAEPLFSAANIGYEADVDRYDPAALAAKLRASTPVLLTCSTNDAQISCADADHLAGGLRAAGVSLDLVRLTGMDHGLKADTSNDGANNTAALPMDPPLAAALARFAH
jgi:uncharacterized protein